MKYIHILTVCLIWVVLFTGCGGGGGTTGGAIVSVNTATPVPTQVPAGTVYGKVFESDGITPVANAFVALYISSDHSTPYKTQITSSDGSYQFTGIITGNVYLEMWKSQSEYLTHPDNPAGTAGGTAGEGTVTINITNTIVVTPATVTPAVQITPVTGNTPAATNTPAGNSTATNTPAQGSLTGKVYNLFTNTAVKDANISINGKTATTDSDGNYTIASAGTGTYRMTVSGNIITRSFPVNLSGGIQNVSVLPSDFNTTMFRALAAWPGHDGTGRWETKPAFVVYKYMWDDPNVAVSQATLDKISSVIAEVGGLGDGFFASPVIEYYNGSASSDPRWTVSYETPEWGYITYGHNAIGISMIQTLSGDNAGFGGGLCDGDSWLRGGGVVLSAQYENYASFQSNLRHEIGHAFALWHPFENLSVSDPHMEESVMNYWPQGSLYGKRSYGFSDADRKALSVIYHRAPDNHSPDTDSDNFNGYYRQSDKLYEFVSE